MWMATFLYILLKSLTSSVAASYFMTNILQFLNIHLKHTGKKQYLSQCHLKISKHFNFTLYSVYRNWARNVKWQLIWESPTVPEGRSELSQHLWRPQESKRGHAEQGGWSPGLSRPLSHLCKHLPSPASPKNVISFTFPAPPNLPPSPLFPSGMVSSQVTKGRGEPSLFWLEVLVLSGKDLPGESHEALISVICLGLKDLWLATPPGS